MSIAHLAPGGTKIPKYTIMPLAARNSPHIPLGPWLHEIPTYTIRPLAAQIPQYHLFRVRTGKYSIPYNPFRWASLQKGHPDK